jgi:hypothetical protein
MAIEVFGERAKEISRSVIHFGSKVRLCVASVAEFTSVY